MNIDLRQNYGEHLMKTIISVCAFLVLSIQFSTNCFADRVKLLETNQEALQARVDLIQNAKSDILVEYYEVANDSLSLTGLSLLKQAAERGVRVKILIDALHNSLTDAQMAAIISNNIEIKVYNPLHTFNPFHLVYRNHDKLLNVDGNTDQAYMIIGGRNAAKNYFGKDETLNFLDADALVSGVSAKESYKYFMTLWNSNPEVKKVNLHDYSNSNLERICSPRNKTNDCEEKKEKNRIEIKQESLKISNYLDLFKSGNSWVKEEAISELLKDIEENVDVHFVFNDPSQSMTSVENKLSAQIMNSLLKNTTNSLTIITPYLYPTEAELIALDNLAARGIKIKIITNSLASNDVVIVHAAFLTIKKRLSDMGIELCLFKGPETLHAKSAIIDEKITFIGSFNFDRKSAQINREIGLKIGSGSKSTSAFSIEFSEFINDKILNNTFLAAKDKIEYSLEELDSTVSLEKKKELKRVQKLVKLVKNLI